MNLIEIVKSLDLLDEEATIYLEEPWTEASGALLAYESEVDEMTEWNNKISYTYFIEVLLAREFLDGWVANLDTKPSLQEQCSTLIDYVINDA